MRRFLRLWGLLSPAYLLATALSSWLVLNLVDLTYEAWAAWLLVPPAQAAVLAARERRRPLLPPGRPPLLALAPLLLALGVAAEGLRRPLDARWGLFVPGTLQELLPRLLALLAGLALLAAALRARKGRAALLPLGALLVLLGLDAARPYLGRLPGTLLPKPGPFLGGLAVYGALLVLLFAAGLAAQKGLEDERPWAARLLGASLALLFLAVQGVLVQLFLHPWLEGAWALLLPAAVAFAAALAAAAGLAALSRPPGAAA